MKKFIFALLMLSGTVGMAQPGFRYHHHGYYPGYGWVAPVVIGGVIGYEIAQPRPPVVVTQQPPIIIQQPQVIQTQNCSPWTEIRNPDGTVTVTRTCIQ